MLLQSELRLRSAIQQAYVAASRDELTKRHLTNAGVVIQADLHASQIKYIAAFIAGRKPENAAQMQEVFEAALVKHLLKCAKKVGAMFGIFLLSKAICDSKRMVGSYTVHFRPQNPSTVTADTLASCGVQFNDDAELRYIVKALGVGKFPPETMEEFQTHTWVR